MKPLQLNLDIKNNSYEEMTLMQGYTYPLEATLTDGGQAFNLTGHTITIELLKADNTFIIQSETITIKDNVVSVAMLKDDFTRVSGTGKLQIVARKGGLITGSWVVSVRIKEGAIVKAVGESKDTVTIKETLDNSIQQAIEENAKTEHLIQTGGAATKGDIAEVNSHLDSIVVNPQMNEINNITSDKTKISLDNKQYTNTSKINLRDNLVVEGRGMEKTIINSTSRLNFFKDVWDRIYNDVELRNFTLNLLNAPTDVVAGIHMKGFKNCIIKNVKVMNNKTEGFYLEDCEDIILINCIADNNKYGFSVTGNSKNILFINCKAINNAWDGFLTNKLINSSFINCYAENNGYSGIDGTACGFYIAKDSFNIKLDGCTSKNNGGRGFELDNVWSCKINNCTCDNDKNGIKVIGTNGGFNKNIVTNCTVLTVNTPLVTISSRYNTFDNITVKATNSDIGIFEDYVGGSNYNTFNNISMDGSITSIANSTQNTSKFTNITINNKRVTVCQPIYNTLYIDFVNGVDTNFGESSSSPIKTISRLMSLIEMQNQIVTIKVLGDTFCLTNTDLPPITAINGQGKIIFDFENRIIVNIPTLMFGSNDISTNITYTLKNVTFSPPTSKAIYNYGSRLYFENVIIPSNVSVESLSGGQITCKNCNITPQMKRDNGSCIVKDRWDSTSIIHVGLIDLSPI